MGHDAVLVDPDFPKEPLAKVAICSEWGYVARRPRRSTASRSSRPIKTLADFERYTPPDPLRPRRYAAVEKALATYGDHHAVIVHLNDVFSLPRYLMGMENLLMAIAAEPELVQALVDMSVEINLTWRRKSPRAARSSSTRATIMRAPTAR